MIIVVILFFVLSTIGAGLYLLSDPLSLSSLALIFWAVTPYTYLALLANTVARPAANVGVLLLTVLIGGSAVIGWVYSTLVEGSQGSLLYIYAPFYQWAAVIVASVPIVLLNRASPGVVTAERTREDTTQIRDPG